MTLFASSWCILTSCLRFAIGRKYFPCGIYLLSYFALPAAVIMPSIFRLFRLYYMHLMNLHKTSIFTLDKQSIENEKQISNNNSNYNNIESDNATKNFELNNNITTSTETTTPNSITTNGNTTNTTNTTTETTTNTTDNNGNKLLQVKAVIYDKQLNEPLDSFFDTTDLDISNMEFKFNENLSMGGKFNFFNRLFKSAEQSHKIMNFLVSYKFIIPIYIIVSIIHIVIFIILGGIEFGITNNRRGPFEDKIFATAGGGIYIFNRGCGSTTNVLIIVAMTTVLYIIFEMIGLVLYFFTDKDTWYIKREALFIVIIQIMTIVLFVIFGFIPIFKFLLDYFIPYGYLFIIYSFTEVVVTVLLPILYSIQYDRKLSLIAENSEIKYFLLKKKTFNMLLDFARRSYAPESILCYKHIETFKKSNKKNRHKIALQIVNTYLKQGSPLELNYPRLLETHDELLKIIESSNGNIETNIFDKISYHCMSDMMDIFERLKSQNKEAKKLVEEWRAVNMKKQ